MQDRILRLVAQDCILLYRGFAIRQPFVNPVAPQFPLPAECNSAIPQIGKSALRRILSCARRLPCSPARSWGTVKQRNAYPPFRPFTHPADCARPGPASASRACKSGWWPRPCVPTTPAPFGCLCRPPVGGSRSCAQRVRGRALVQPRLGHSGSHGPRQVLRPQVMPPQSRASRSSGHRRRRCLLVRPARQRPGRKHPLPRPISRGGRILPRQRVRQSNPGVTVPHIRFVLAAHPFEVFGQRPDQLFRHHRDPVLSALAVAHDDAPPLKSRSLMRSRSSSLMRKPLPYNIKRNVAKSERSGERV